jgi:hypothetical protein
MTTQKRTTQVITKTQKTKNHATPWERAKNARPNATGATIKLTSHGFLGTAADRLSQNSRSLTSQNPHVYDRKTRTDQDPSAL